MKRSLCFLAGFLMAVAMLLSSVLLPAADTARFEEALLSTVNRQALGVSESDLSAFAEETMRYLRGETPQWQPAISLYGMPAETSIPASFRAHMAEVRGWAAAAPWISGCAIALGLGLLRAGGWQRKPALLGICTLLVLVAGALIWAAADFHSFWMVLHRAFIPGGIFAFDEPVMQLFPLALFLRYVGPVALCAAALLGGLCLLVNFLKPKGQIR